MEKKEKKEEEKAAKKAEGTKGRFDWKNLFKGEKIQSSSNHDFNSAPELCQEMTSLGEKLTDMSVGEMVRETSNGYETSDSESEYFDAN